MTDKVVPYVGITEACEFNYDTFEHKYCEYHNYEYTLSPANAYTCLEKCKSLNDASLTIYYFYPNTGKCYCADATCTKYDTGLDAEMSLIDSASDYAYCNPKSTMRSAQQNQYAATCTALSTA